MADKDIKQTKAVVNIMEALKKLLPILEEGDVDTDKYSPIPCSSCIHNNKHVGEKPCSTCSSATPDIEPKRDYRPSDKCYWEPNNKATITQIRMYHALHGIKKYSVYKKYPPHRCINPRCRNNYGEVYKKGLCNKCFSILNDLVKKDNKISIDYAIMYKLADNEEEKELALKLYMQTYTWDRFINEGRCLPEDEDKEYWISSRALKTYMKLAAENSDKIPAKQTIKNKVRDRHLDNVLEGFETKVPEDECYSKQKETKP